MIKKRIKNNFSVLKHKMGFARNSLAQWICAEIEDLRDLWVYCKTKKKKFIHLRFGVQRIEALFVEATSFGHKICASSSKSIKLTKDNETKVIHFINQFVEQCNVKPRDVVVCLSSDEEVFIKHFVLPVLPNNEINLEVKKRLNTIVNFNADDPSYDWQIVRKYIDDDGLQRYGVLCAAINSSVVDKYLSVINACRLECSCLTADPVVLGQLYFKENKLIDTFCVLDVSFRHSSVNVYVDNKLLFMRKINFSWDKLVKSLTSEMVTCEGERKQLTTEQAEAIVKRVGVPFEDDNYINSMECAEDQGIVSLLMPVFKDLEREIKLTIDYFVQNFNLRAPQKILLSGLAKRLLHLDKYLNNQLNLNVGYPHFPNDVDIEDDNQEANKLKQNALLKSVASATINASTINMLPLELKMKGCERTQKKLLRFSSFVFIVLFLFVLFVLNFQTNIYNKKIIAQKKHLADVQEIIQVSERISSYKTFSLHLARRRATINDLIKSINVLTFHKFDLKEINFDSENYLLIMRGSISYSQNNEDNLVETTLLNLKNSRYIDDIELISTNESEATQEFIIKNILRQ